MTDTNWLRQIADKPLFPDLIWSRPENKRQAGRLLIIGGNAHGFADVVAAYNTSLKAGIGEAMVLLPDSLEKTIGKSFPEAVFAPSTNVGSFARRALDTLLDQADRVDGVLLAGDFGRNSETAILLDSFIKKYEGQINITGDIIDYFANNPDLFLARYNFFITSNIEKLQKLLKGSVSVKQNVDLAQNVKQLQQINSVFKPAIMTHHENQILASYEGNVSSTASKEINEAQLAAYASVWLAQQPQKVFEALTSAAFDYSKPT